MFSNGVIHIMMVVLLWATSLGIQVSPRALVMASTMSRGLAGPNFTVLAAPATFDKVSPQNGATGQPTTGMVLSWSASTPGVTYQYCLSTNGKCLKTKWKSVGSNLTVTLPTLSSNTLYYWQIRAVSGTTYTEANGGLWTFRTRPATVQPGPFTKTSPTNNTLNTSINGLSLSWSASANATGYRYCYDTVNNNVCDTTWVDAYASRSATINDLSYSQTYYWQVRALTATSSLDADANVWYAFTTTFAPPQDFSKRSPALGAGDQPISLTLSWDASTGQNITYEYCFDTDGGATCASTPTWTSAGAATSAPVSGLAYDTTYSWQVRAKNATGTTAANTATYWTFTTRIAPPSGFSKSAPQDGLTGLPRTYTLSWGTSTGKDITYEYCYDASGGAICANTVNWTSAGTSTSAPISGLAYDTTYFWQVRARNTSGTVQANSGAYWRFATRIAPPSDFMKASPDDGTTVTSLDPTISWGTSTGRNITYEYCYTATVDAITCDKLWYPAGANTQAVLHGLEYDTLYRWQVRAVNTSGTVYADTGALHSFRTPVAPPQAFTKLSPSLGLTGQPVDITLSWSASAGAEEYYYCIDKTNNNICDAGWVQISRPTPESPLPTQVTPPTLDYNQTVYYWQVFAVNDQGEVYANNNIWWSFTTQEALPVDFTKISPAPVDVDVQRTPSLYWWSGDSQDVDYQYCINTTNSCPSEEAWESVPSGLSVQVPAEKSLLPGTLYYWQVRAVNTSGETEANSGTWWSFTTIKAGPIVTDQSFPDGHEGQMYTGTLTAESNYGKLFSLVGSRPVGNLILHNDGTFEYTPPTDFEGTVTFHFTVSDGFNPQSDRHTATIEIIGSNDAPELTLIPDQQVKTGSPVRIFITASDPDIPYGDILTLSITEPLPQGATFDPATGEFFWTPTWTNLHLDPYSFTAVVQDKAGESVQQVFHVTVTPNLYSVPMINRLP